MSATLRVRVIPRAKRTEWGGRRGESVVVRLQAPPVEGAANEALVKFLAAALRVPPRAIEIVSGEHARDKVLRVTGLSEAELRERVPE